MRISATLALLVLLAPSTLAYTVVRKDGSKFTTEAAPVYKEGQATFTLAGGSTGSIPESAVDKAATEKVNAASAKKGEPKKAFTNEDLKNAKGLSDSGGEVKSEPGSTGDADGASKDWSERHDREMAERDKASREAAGSQEARVKELEEKVRRLETELRETDPSYSYSKDGKQVDQGFIVAEHKRIAGELDAAKKELAEAKGEE